MYRLNPGLARGTSQELFGPPPAFNAPAIELGYDFTVLEQLLPHPVYVAMAWAWALSSKMGRFKQLRPLL